MAAAMTSARPTAAVARVRGRRREEKFSHQDVPIEMVADCDGWMSPSDSSRACKETHKRSGGATSAGISRAASEIAEKSAKRSWHAEQLARCSRASAESGLNPFCSRTSSRCLHCIPQTPKSVALGGRTLNDSRKLLDSAPELPWLRHIISILGAGL